MLKRNSAIFKILLIVIISALFLLIYGGIVHADETKWEAEKKVGFWLNDQKGDKLTGTTNGIAWEATIEKEDKAKETGEVSFKVTNGSSLEGKDIVIPDKVYISGVISYAYKVTSITSDSFKNCKGIKNIELGKYVRSIDASGFNDCSSLMNIRVSSSNENFISVDGILYNYEKTTLIKFPNGKTISKSIIKNIPTTVTTFGSYSFANNNTSDVEFNVPTNVTTIGKYCFQGFSNLKKIDLSNINSIEDGAFSGCTSLSEVRIPNTVTTIGKSTFEKCTSLVDVIIEANITSISDKSFYECTSLKNVIMPNTITAIGEGAFYSCKGLSNITLSTELKTISRYAFTNTYALKQINISELTKLETIGDYAFTCSGLKSVEIPKTDSGVKIESYAFGKCGNLKVVVLPDNAQLIQTTTVTNEVQKTTHFSGNDNLIIYCTNIDQLKDENADTKPMMITYEKYGDTNSIKLINFIDSRSVGKNITIEGRINGLPVSIIGDSMFKDKTTLESVKIPNTVTTIESSAFSGCTGLTDIVISKYVKVIDDDAFRGCSHLALSMHKSLTKDNIEIGSNAFKDVETIYCGTEEMVTYLKEKYTNVTLDKYEPIFDLTSEMVGNNYNVVKIKWNNLTDQGGSGAYKILAYTNAANQEYDSFVYIDEIGDSATVTKTQIGEEYVCWIAIMDRVGNIGTVRKTITTFDIKAPTITVSELKDYSPTVEVTFDDYVNGSECISGLAGYKILQKKYEDEGLIGESGWRTLTGNTQTIKISFDEIGDWYIYVKDNSGNIAVSDKITLTEKNIDNTKPEVASNVTYTYNKDNNGNVLSVTVGFTVSDSGSGVSYYRIDDKKISDVEAYKTAKIWDEKEFKEYKATYTGEFTFEKPGTYYVHAYDAFGNVNIDDPEITINIPQDLIAPKILFANEKTDDDLVKVTILDSYTGIKAGAKISYAFSESNTVAPTKWENVTLAEYTEGTDEISFNADASKLTGNLYLWINAEELSDVKGNTKTGTVYSENAYTFDNTAPTLTIAQDKTIINVNSKVKFTLTGSEEIELKSDLINKIVLSVEGETTGQKIYEPQKVDNKTYTIELEAGTLNGKLTITIPKELFVDKVGNTLDKDYTATVTVDNAGVTIPTKAEETDQNILISETKTIDLTFNIGEVVTLDNTKQITLTGDGITGDVSAKLSEDGKKLIVTLKNVKGNGKAGLKFPEGLLKDSVGNNSNAIEVKDVVTVDNTKPTAKLIDLNIDYINSSRIATFTVEFSKPVSENTGKQGGSLECTEGVNANLLIEHNSTYTVWTYRVVYPTGNGEIKLKVCDMIDSAGNALESITFDETITVDNTKPIINSSEIKYNEEKTKATLVIVTKDKEYKYISSINMPIVLRQLLGTTLNVENYQNYMDEVGKLKDINSTVITREVEENGTFLMYIFDKAGNYETVEFKVTEINDKIVPTISKIDGPNPKSIRTGNSAEYVITFSESVKKSDTLNATLEGTGSNDSKVELTKQSDNTWIAKVTAGSTEGDISLVLPAGLFIDNTNNATTESKTITGLKVDNTKSTIKVEKERTDNGVKVRIISNEELAAINGWTLTTDKKELYKVVTENLNKIKVSDIAGNETEVEVGLVFPTSDDLTIENIVSIPVNESKKLSIKDGISKETLKWTSSDSSVVAVDNEGNISGKKAGTAVITVESIANSAIKKTCSVTISSRINVTGVQFTVSDQNLEINTATDMSKCIKVLPENATNKNVTWSSNNTKVATVDENGKVTAVGNGTATIKVTTKEGEYSASIKVKTYCKTSSEVTGVTLNKSVIRMVKGNTNEELKATVLPETLNTTMKDVVWSSTNENIVKVDKNTGKITAISAGEAEVVATTIYGGKTASCKVYVTDNEIQVTNINLSKSSVNLFIGETDTITIASILPANATNQDNITWESSNIAVATVGNGKITAIAEGTAIISAKANNGVKGECKVTVSKYVNVTEITLNKTETEMCIGENLLIQATVKPENATDNTLVWSSSDETKAKVVDGKITALATGNVTITATSKVNNKVVATCKITIKESNKTGFTDKIDYDIIVKDDVKYLTGIQNKTTLNQIVKLVESDFTVTVKDAKGNEIAKANYSKVVGTGMTITLTNGSKTITYIFVVEGDCTGDGIVNAVDLLEALKQYKGKGSKLTTAQMMAIKVSNTTNYSAVDLINQLKLYKKINL